VTASETPCCVIPPLKPLPPTETLNRLLDQNKFTGQESLLIQHAPALLQSSVVSLIQSVILIKTIFYMFIVNDRQTLARYKANNIMGNNSDGDLM
jgi:hypothetical protein